MNAVAAVALIWASQFYLNIVFMIMLLSTIALMNVIIAISGDKFSTHHKYSTFIHAGFDSMALLLIVFLTLLQRNGHQYDGNGWAHGFDCR